VGHAREPRVLLPKEDAGTVSRADRVAAAHAWVLEHHAETFAKLAK
jgi:hypothetical protein